MIGSAVRASRASGVSVHHARSVALRRLPRWMSGIRNRSQATRMRERRSRAHPRAALVEPADRHDGDPIAAPAGEVDELDVEDDAGDPLSGEQVLGGGSRETP